MLLAEVLKGDTTLKELDLGSEKARERERERERRMNDRQ